MNSSNSTKWTARGSSDSEAKAGGGTTSELSSLLSPAPPPSSSPSLDATAVQTPTSHTVIASNTNATLAKARNLLYLSHLFSQFSEVAWQFCLVLFLAAFADYESFFLVSTYGILSGLVVCLAGSRAGRFIDDENRLFVARTFIWTENTAVLGATLCCYALLSRDVTRYVITPEGDGEGGGGADGEGRGGWSEWFEEILDGVPVDAGSVALLVAIHIMGSVAKILDRGFIVAIERDWIVVMSTLASSQHSASDEESAAPEGENMSQKAWLSETNVALKQIDLSCKVAAPAMAGFFVAAFGDGGSHGEDLKGAALLVGALNASALVVEYVCTKRIYDLIPNLAVKHAPRIEECAEMKGKTAEDQTSPSLGQSVSSSDRTTLSSFSDMLNEGRKNKRVDENKCRRFYSRWVPDGIRVYLKQPISSGGIALALLYLNILTFGAIMTAYLVWRGMRLQTIGVWRGISSAVGLMGTFVFHYSASHLTLEQTGMWSILFQFSALSVSYTSLFIDSYDTSLSMLIGGVCTSRVGLWVFDITITQLMQELIPEEARGIVGGVQQSINSFFELLTFVLGILFPDPRYFHVLVFAGYASVAVAALLYGVGVFARRDKLH